jgi:periplasmic protein TonB
MTPAAQSHVLRARDEGFAPVRERPVEAADGATTAAPAAPPRMPRGDAISWAICFAIVLSAHIGAAVALISAPEPSDYGIEGPVVTLDLPESFVTTDAPPTDLAPGPKEEQSEATPPPKEETKPAEPEADVAMPEPPKPEPPQEERQATAPVASKATPKSITRWESTLAAHIDRFKRYPSEARAHGEQGVATVVFTMNRDGRVLTSRIVQSSGSAALDQETLQMLTRAQPMPKPPDGMQGMELSLAVPIRFNIR